MKKSLIVITILTIVIWCLQAQLGFQVDLLGVWTVTDFHDPNKFEDTWEFKANGIFNELKYVSDGDAIMAPDENGSWNVEDNELLITITGEYHNGNQVRYEKPQVTKFKVSKGNDEYILDVIEENDASDGTILKLRLSNRE